jgi:hypothetical protein
MTADRQITEDRYQVIVVETDDLLPRNESGKPNLATSVTVSDPAKKFERLMSGTSGPQWIRGHVVALNSNLSLTKIYPTLQRARTAERRLISRLLREGYIVNKRAPHRRVYVVELDGSHLVTPGKGYLYVGETSKHPEVRLAEHLNGTVSSNGHSLASKVVKRYGRQLRPELAPKEFFLTKAEAELAEAECRRQLEAAGYRCEGAHLLRTMQPC